MVSELKNVQILVDLLKQYDVKHIVLSSGMTSVPVIHSLEDDHFFKCYSNVDERGAAYFAMGIAQETKEPVALVCTSGTAACNYFPAVTEAYYQRVPLIVITCDKRPYELGQHILQKINQENMFGDKCFKAVNIPIIDNQEKENYCVRKVNEVLIDVVTKQRGPAHINIETGGNRTFIDGSIIRGRKIEYLSDLSSQDGGKIRKEIAEKRILIIAGQSCGYDASLIEKLNKFCESYDCVLIRDHMSNIECNRSINAFPLLESMGPDFFGRNLLPNIVISFGGNILSSKLNEFLKNNRDLFESWRIEEKSVSGEHDEIVDSWGNLTKLFNMKLELFLEEMLGGNITNTDGTYFEKWKNMMDNIKYVEDIPLSNVYVAKKLAEIIPSRSILHTGILNSTRVMNFYKLNPEVKTFSNIGALGIDGSLSSFLGQASNTNQKAFLLIGDLSFIYDMNALNIRYLSNNIYIVMLNNGGGGEFYYNIGKAKIPNIDDFIAASHNTLAEGWVKSRGFEYFSARTVEEFNSSLSEMMSSNVDKPHFMEVFTDKETDAQLVKEFYRINYVGSNVEVAKKKVKAMIGVGR